MNRPNLSSDTAAMPRPAPRLRWQSAAYALATIILAFVVPAIALCKVVPLSSIVMAIVATTFACGVGLVLASRNLEARTPLDDRVDYYLQASIFVFAAGLLWGQLASQSAPWRERTLSRFPRPGQRIGSVIHFSR